MQHREQQLHTVTSLAYLYRHIFCVYTDLCMCVFFTRDRKIGQQTDRLTKNESNFTYLYVFNSLFLLVSYLAACIQWVGSPHYHYQQRQLQFRCSVVPTLWGAINCSMPGLPVHHQLPEFTQTHVHRVGDAIQPSHPLPSPSPPDLNLSQHQGLFK